MTAYLVCFRSELLGVPHFEYWFEVDGERKALYLGEVEISLFIESVVGKLSGDKLQIGPFTFRIVYRNFSRGAVIVVLDGRFWRMRALWYGRSCILRNAWANLRIRLLMTAWVWGLAERNNDATEPVLKSPWRKYGSHS